MQMIFQWMLQPIQLIQINHFSTRSDKILTVIIEPYTGQHSLCPTDNTTTVYTEIQKCFGYQPVCDEVPTAKPTPSGLPPCLH